MKVTSKHQLEYTGSTQVVKVPADAEALAVHKIGDNPFLYVAGNSDTGEQDLKIVMLSENGSKVKDNYVHIGTILVDKSAVHIYVVQ